MSTTSPAEYETRIRALEKQCATLAAEVDRLNGEVDKWQRYAKDLEHDIEESEKHFAQYHHG